ncbi:transcription factor btf3 [Ceratobasidium sp. AG-Ba]|nr:transcription factor btf3 [Ceratobasidium sp. AG-Ba]
MDEPGFHARKRAAKQDAYYYNPQHGYDGRYMGVEMVQPMNEPWVGGFQAQGQSGGGMPMPTTQGSVVMPPAAQHGYAEPSYRPPAWVPDLKIPGSTFETSHDQGSASHPGPPLSAVERSEQYRSVPRMRPHLQLMCGPLLRYDSVVNRVWYGAVMVVTADAGSQYNPHPMLHLEWDPLRPSHVRPSRHQRSQSVSTIPPPMTPPPVAPGMPPPIPYPYQPHISQPVPPTSFQPTAAAQQNDIPGQEIWVYNGASGSFTFWRFLIEIPLGPEEMGVRYRVNMGQEIEFFVPGLNQNMRWAAHSCNGFSAGINPDDFRGPGHSSGFDPLWTDLLEKHAEKPYHALVGGGDQIYCDALMREPELQGYVGLKTPKEKISAVLTDEIAFAIDRFYFSHYCLVFRNGSFAKANSSIPMVNMLDDHDLIDGFGSYPDDLQMSPIFRTIGSRGYFFFLLFQCFVVDEVDGINPNPRTHTNKSMIIGGDGPWIPAPSHSLLTYMGPKVWMLLLDCRAERRKDLVCSQTTYDRVFWHLNQLPHGVEHVIIQLGIPIAYPRMNFLETALESKLNPLTSLAQKGSLGLSGFVNKFNKDPELLDDLNDHWTAKSHKKERNWFVERVQEYARNRHIRVTFLSGDVHCAAVGYFKTLVRAKARALDPANDHRYMLNVVTSAIVNTPPPAAVLTMVGMLADRVHKTMHYVDTDESMLPLFQNDTTGQPLKQKFIMGRRNYTSVDLDQRTGDLVFDIRVEESKGAGRTVSYEARAPPPRW